YLLEAIPVSAHTNCLTCLLKSVRSVDRGGVFYTACRPCQLFFSVFLASLPLHFSSLSLSAVRVGAIIGRPIFSSTLILTSAQNYLMRMRAICFLPTW